MARYKLTLEYDGTGLCGWQRQDGLPSVQSTIEEAIAQFANADVEVFASGRTDAGVHATGQVVHFDMEQEREDVNVRRGINFYLNERHVVVVKAERVADDFHARFSAKQRHYTYKITNRSPELVLDKWRAWHVYTPLDIDAMTAGAQHLLGKHDFTSFRDTHCQASSPIKNVDAITFKRLGEHIEIYVSAKSFLHHQVRIMVGSLVHVGAGKWQPNDIAIARDARDRTKAGVTAPAHGLYFTSVDY